MLVKIVLGSQTNIQLGVLIFTWFNLPSDIRFDMDCTNEEMKQHVRRLLQSQQEGRDWKESCQGTGWLQVSYYRNLWSRKLRVSPFLGFTRVEFPLNLLSGICPRCSSHVCGVMHYWAVWALLLSWDVHWLEIFAGDSTLPRLTDALSWLWLRV